MFEIWRPVFEYEKLYEVSNYGRIKNSVTGKILKPIERPNGYYQVSLCKDGKPKSHKVHRTVARAFPEICGEWFEGCDVNHKDENKKNNCALNLEVCSHRDNCLYSVIKHSGETKNTNTKTEDLQLQITPYLSYNLNAPHTLTIDNQLLEIMCINNLVCKS